MEEDLTVGHLVGRVAGDDLRRCRLTGAVGSHQGVYLAGVDLKIDTAKNGFAVLFCDRCVKIADFECCHL